MIKIKYLQNMNSSLRDIWTKMWTKWCTFFQVTVIEQKHKSMFYLKKNIIIIFKITFSDLI